MTSKGSLFLLLRVIFVIFSLYFIRDAFFYWDGLSYYTTYGEFLPDAAFVLMIWTILAVMLAVVIWMAVELSSRLISLVVPVKTEHLMTFLLISYIGLFLLSVSYNFLSGGYLSSLIKNALSDIMPQADSSVLKRTIAAVGGLVLIGFVWFIRDKCRDFMNWLRNFVTPLVWIFGLMVIAAVPLSMMKGVLADDIPAVESESIEAVDVSLQRPNIIIVAMDALTAHDMELYGYERPTTPFISDWAKDAVVFDSLYSSSNWTLPTTMSLMTGQRVWTHRQWFRAINRHIYRYGNNMVRQLSDNGYDTYAFVQNAFAHPEIIGMDEDYLRHDKYYSFNQPETWWLDRLGRKLIDRFVVYRWFFVESNFVGRIIKKMRPDFYETMMPSEIVYDRFLEVAEARQRNGDKDPFFAYIHLWPPHDPYLAPEPFMGMFGDPEAYNSYNKQKFSNVLSTFYPDKLQPEVDKIRKRYDELIVYSDDRFRKFISRLSETVDMSNTVIVLTADHGESFEHNHVAHGSMHLYESFINIPLVIKMPEGAGRVINIPVEQTDIAPTILEIAGVKIPDWIEGRSLLSAVEGRVFEPRPVYSMKLIGNRSFGQQITKGTVAVREGDYKLIYYLDDEKTLLFNISADPGEMEDLSKERPEIVQRMKQMIDSGLSEANKRILEGTLIR